LVAVKIPGLSSAQKQIFTGHREGFRHHSFTAKGAFATIFGCGHREVTACDQRALPKGSAAKAKADASENAITRRKFPDQNMARQPDDPQHFQNSRAAPGGDDPRARNAASTNRSHRDRDRVPGAQVCGVRRSASNISVAPRCAKPATCRSGAGSYGAGQKSPSTRVLCPRRWSN